MAKITITIEDRNDGTVKVVSDPSVETLFKMDLSGHNLTSAHGYALSCLNKIRQISKEKSSENKIFIPKLIR